MSNSKRVSPVLTALYESDSNSVRFSNQDNVTSYLPGKRSRVSSIRKLKASDEEYRSDFEFRYKQALIALAINFTHLFLGPIVIPILYMIFGRSLCTNLGFGRSRYYFLELLNFC